MAPLMIASRFPSAVTVTVTVKGEPAVAVGGAVNSRIACVVPQPNVIDTAIAAVNTLSRRADGSFPVLNRGDLPRNLTSRRTKLESTPCTLFELYSNNRAQYRDGGRFNCRG